VPAGTVMLIGWKEKSLISTCGVVVVGVVVGVVVVCPESWQDKTESTLNNTKPVSSILLIGSLETFRWFFILVLLTIDAQKIRHYYIVLCTK
jgi:hypothetical protein